MELPKRRGASLPAAIQKDLVTAEAALHICTLEHFNRMAEDLKPCFASA
jgi:hypothetical protein